MQGAHLKSRISEGRKVIEEIYGELKKLGVVRNCDQFSCEWLGMERSYLRVARAKRRQPSAKAIATCVARLKSHGRHLMRVDGQRYQSAAMALNRMADLCIDEMVRRYEVHSDAHL